MVGLGLGLSRFELAWSQYGSDSPVSAETVIYKAFDLMGERRQKFKQKNYKLLERVGGGSFINGAYPV